MATTYDPKEHGPIQLAENRAHSARQMAEAYRREAAGKIAAAEKKEAEAEYWQMHRDFLALSSWKDEGS